MLKKILSMFLSKIKGGNSNKVELYVVSYPKSGRTWLRALLGKYLIDKYKLSEEDLFSAHNFSFVGWRNLSFTNDGAQMTAQKNYDDLSIDKSKYTNKRVVFLARNIKDVIVSAYFQATKRKNIFKGDISEFIRDERFGARKLITFYYIWQKSLHIPKELLFITYEDMHEDIDALLKKVLSFFGEKEIDSKSLTSSIEFCAFENLQKFEKNNKLKSSALRPKNVKDKDSYKVRQGKVGGYTDYLSDDDIKYIDNLIAEYGLDFSKFRQVSI